MTQQSTTPQSSTPQNTTPQSTYEIVIRGRAGPRLLRPLLDDFVVDHTDAGLTRLVGDITDPAHLHGVLAHLTSFNAEVVSVSPLPSHDSHALHDPYDSQHSHDSHHSHVRSSPMITVSGVTKHYGKRAAVQDMTFGVQAGRVTGFVGPNGAGKSTTMRVMVGLTRPDTGDVRYDGIHYTDLKHPATVVGAVLETRSMHPGRTARNHLRAMAAISGIPAARVDEVLVAVGLETAAGQRAGGFSLGMRQRLALAGALLGDPQVLLLDEPSNGLDPDGIRWLRTFLTDFAGRGGTVFVSSHVISELSMFADDLIVIGGGRLLAAESVASILERGESRVVVETRQPAELVRLLAEQHIVAEATGDRLLVHGTTKAAVSQIAYDHHVRVVEITEITTSLEDRLLDMTKASTEFAAA
ncbi:ATP-binding cassette domain-containing protein [Streptomyces sp. NBC_00006]|uniref:ATP-binding cassette domain-containing protein n=1 Tax=Streptomyces sp. NBC_00006 TaxID=2975619 RepID=UPI002256678D|nr:ATP-binding cassette domain-containing protein [Streptomyces sp. NBC_00006]MCX5529508.1 ATP-binding cassette domain-containing protein [Streptomyces sp. NBC_00006]